MVLYTQISYVNERVKIKGSRQNDREIRVQEDNIMENTNERSPLVFRNLLFVIAYMQSHKRRRQGGREAAAQPNWAEIHFTRANVLKEQ